MIDEKSKILAITIPLVVVAAVVVAILIFFAVKIYRNKNKNNKKVSFDEHEKKDDLAHEVELNDSATESEIKKGSQQGHLDPFIETRVNQKTSEDVKNSGALKNGSDNSECKKVVPYQAAGNSSRRKGESKHFEAVDVLAFALNHFGREFKRQAPTLDNSKQSIVGENGYDGRNSKGSTELYIEESDASNAKDLQASGKVTFLSHLKGYAANFVSDTRDISGKAKAMVSDLNDKAKARVIDASNAFTSLFRKGKPMQGNVKGKPSDAEIENGSSSVDVKQQSMKGYTISDASSENVAMQVQRM